MVYPASAGGKEGDPLRRWIAGLLAIALALSMAGCQKEKKPGIETAGRERLGLEETMAQSLGLLNGLLSEEEQGQVRAALESVWEVREARLSEGEYEMSPLEEERMERYNQLLDDLTQRYLGWGETEEDPEEVPAGEGESETPETGETPELPEETQEEAEEEVEQIPLADFTIENGTTITNPTYYEGWEEAGFQQKDADAVWEFVQSVLPQGALKEFEDFYLFSDGEYNTLAYVNWDGNRPVSSHWGIALDLADLEDVAELILTVIHEYCHYLTLKEGQALNTDNPGVVTYCENNLETLKDSYLNEFYWRYWGFLADERRSGADQELFYLRHNDLFCTEYAVTDPSEDIAESFSYYVVLSEEERQNMPEPLREKLNYFEEVPLFSQFRQDVREKLGMKENDHWWEEAA